MFCRQCGAELEEGARFCAYCGTKAYGAEGHDTSTSADPSTSLEHQETESDTAAQPRPLATISATTADAHDETQGTTGSTGTTSSAANGPDDGKTAVGAGAEATADQAEANPTSSTSLKAAVKATRKRSLRKMPTILLVALALALATSVAYAAYQVYTQVWAPYQAQQQAAQGGGATATSEYVDVWVVDSARNTVAASEIDTHVGEVSYEVTYSYDEAGKLVEQTTSTFGSVPSTAVQTYEYDGLLPTSIANEIQIVAGNEYGGATETTLEYDNQNRCTSMSTLVIRKGDGGEQRHYSYDELGRISSIASKWISGEEIAAEETLQISYDTEDSEGADPHISADSSSLEDSERSTSTLRSIYEDAEYDEYGNLIAVTGTDSSATSSRIEYTYKKITVKRDEWLPNPWSNPTLGTGELSEYGTEFTYYSLKPERIEEIMTANE